MAKNDVVLIDAIVDERLREVYPSNQRDEVFEFLAFEQVLKDFDLSREEIEAGWVDGRDDGGIDGFFVFVNGHLLQDVLTFAWPKRSAEVEVRILTCKHHETFQQAPINTLLASIPELFDLRRDTSELWNRYSVELLEARALLHTAYQRLAVASPAVTVRFAYVSRGDSSAVAPNVQARADQLVSAVKALFSQWTATFDFVGAAELVSLYRRIKAFSLELPVLECMPREPGSCVALARLDDYYRFDTDETGNLRRYLFESNVRDYLGENRVNEDIGASLKDAEAPEFWWLNNGITLLVTAATPVGNVLQLRDVQIVNGLQTTETIFRHFSSGNSASAERGLLVKVVVSSDPAVRDQIIRATNNQSSVEAASLHATDKLQRDIEAVLERHDWYYERRKNYYRDIGKPPARFVTPLYLAGGYVSLVMKNPVAAARLRFRVMRTTEAYYRVFSESVPLQIWVTVTEVLKRVEDGLSQVRPTQGSRGERFLAQWRNLVALLTVAGLFGRFSYGITDLVGLDVGSITPALAIEMWRLVESVQRMPAKEPGFQSASFVQKCCRVAATRYGIADPKVVGRGRPASAESRPKQAKPAPSEALVLQVNDLLPAQPWKPGVHRAVASQLGCSPRLVSAAIDELVRSGMRQQQKDGIVYDSSGQIVAVDEERVRKGEVPRPNG
jgi:AIPR protein